MRMLRILASITGLLMCCCSGPPLVVHMATPDSPVRQRKKVKVRVDITNRSRKTQTLPMLATIKGETSMDGCGPLFLKSLKTKEDGVYRMGLNICPPYFERMKPGEMRSFDFAWTPEKEDVGAGFLFFLAAPKDMKAPDPVPITVQP